MSGESPPACVSYAVKQATYSQGSLYSTLCCVGRPEEETPASSSNELKKKAGNEEFISKMRVQVLFLKLPHTISGTVLGIKYTLVIEVATVYFLKNEMPVQAWKF